jgi:hypothetical protein
MMNRKPPIFPLILLSMGLLSCAIAQSPPAGTDSLLNLEARQGGEARKLDKVAGDVASLLADLESNGLLEQGDSNKFGEFKEVVQTVANTRLPAAAQHFRSARMEKDSRRLHLVSADEEVKAIVKELGAVLAGSSALLVGEELVQELKDMIKVQSELRGKSAEWAKAMLINPETAEAGKGQLIQDQTAMLARYQQFIAKLGKSRDETTDDAAKSRLQQAEQVLNPKPPALNNKAVSAILTAEPTTGDVIQAAIDQLGVPDVLSVVGAQDRVIETFKAALQILSAGQSDLAELVAGLEKLIEKQKVLRKETEAEANLEGRKSFYEARQVEIQNEATNYSFDAPDLFVSKEGEFLVEPLMISLGEAVTALKEAKKEKALPAQDKIIALLQSVYGTATDAAEEEGKTPFWADSPVVPEELWQLPKDEDKEDLAKIDKDFPEIFEPITSAALTIQSKNATKGAQADVTTAMAANKTIGLEEEDEDSKPPDFITDEGPPSMSKKEASNAPGGEGEGDTSDVEKDRLARDSMQRQQQKAKVQDYARQLPPEFRRQVADYYESISE